MRVFGIFKDSRSHLLSTFLSGQELASDSCIMWAAAMQLVWLASFHFISLELLTMFFCTPKLCCI